MKKIFLAAAMLAFCATPVFAQSGQTAGGPARVGIPGQVAQPGGGAGSTVAVTRSGGRAMMRHNRSKKMMRSKRGKRMMMRSRRGRM